MKRALFELLSVILGLSVVLGLAELWSRTQPPPRIQQVLLLQGRTDIIDGVAVWREPGGSDERENFGCVGERHILVLGSSILYGSGLSYEESLGPQLQRLQPGLCVHNLSQPGFTFQNQYAVARRALSGPLAETPIDLVLLEIWENSVNRLEVVGDRAYNFGTLVVDALGLPNPFELAPGLNRWLFATSGLYRYTNLTRAAVRPHSVRDKRWRDFAEGPLRRAIALAEERGARLLPLFMPTLRQPFAESAAEPIAAYAPARAVFAAESIPTLDAAALLEDASVEALRADPCCHYNAAGMRRLAEALAPAVLPDGLNRRRP